ncbi:acyl dehydratase [Rhodovulum sp. BSW8]|uniref:MaoC dehydratase-like protein n=1 Tax=Rhodovulum visakhapatnamense TaxID=364297 RepID=A0A4R8FEI6_9RHOB|nr:MULTISPECIES: MaoC/PaaZ C-terminal domain-containing protein [Rhodovulum]OLS43537.1 hypothetical protein BV509_03815 [Rhodovulum sulfidophilum]MBL3570157.1 hypothetical protein [Rhodovulum visakhapatnamense]MBL3577642.1 hypothetical protein [Rhodovulum visakhapatnamense]RBO53983.1 acyl dehydratase [Rhodovulum sp. BSW8]TDX24286.1 MaoC dehydratase-like protein [Rhodovulum visakhapatnamense]
MSIERGQSVTFRKTLTVADQGFFTGISGNLGPAHVDRVKAQALGLPDMAVFELAAGALFSTALARLAGPEYRIGNISMSFHRTITLGETFAATATSGGAEGKSLVCQLKGEIGGQTVVSGEATLVLREG